MNLEIVKAWYFESESSSKLHETLLYLNGNISCSCPGWTKRAKKEDDGTVTRTCKHVRLVDAAMADIRCRRTVTTSVLGFDKAWETRNRLRQERSDKLKQCNPRKPMTCEQREAECVRSFTFD